VTKSGTLDIDEIQKRLKEQVTKIKDEMPYEEDATLRNNLGELRKPENIGKMGKISKEIADCIEEIIKRRDEEDAIEDLCTNGHGVSPDDVDDLYS